MFPDPSRPPSSCLAAVCSAPQRSGGSRHQTNKAGTFGVCEDCKNNNDDDDKTLLLTQLKAKIENETRELLQRKIKRQQQQLQKQETLPLLLPSPCSVHHSHQNENSPRSINVGCTGKLMKEVFNSSKVSHFHFDTIDLVGLNHPQNLFDVPEMDCNAALQNFDGKEVQDLVPNFPEPKPYLQLVFCLETINDVNSNSSKDIVHHHCYEQLSKPCNELTVVIIKRNRSIPYDQYHRYCKKDTNHWNYSYYYNHVCNDMKHKRNETSIGFADDDRKNDVCIPSETFLCNSSHYFPGTPPTNDELLFNDQVWLLSPSPSLSDCTTPTVVGDETSMVCCGRKNNNTEQKNHQQTTHHNCCYDWKTRSATKTKELYHSLKLRRPFQNHHGANKQKNMKYRHLWSQHYQTLKGKKQCTNIMIKDTSMNDAVTATRTTVSHPRTNNCSTSTRSKSNSNSNSTLERNLLVF